MVRHFVYLRARSPQCIFNIGIVPKASFQGNPLATLDLSSKDLIYTRHIYFGTHLGCPSFGACEPHLCAHICSYAWEALKLCVGFFFEELKTLKEWSLHSNPPPTCFGLEYNHLGRNQNLKFRSYPPPNTFRPRIKH